MLKTKMVLKARPAMEKTATATIISTRVQAANRLTNGLIDIILDPIAGDECGGSAGMRDAAVGPVHGHIHQDQVCTYGRSADIGGAPGGNRSIIGDALVPGGRLRIVNSGEGRRNEAVGI